MRPKSAKAAGSAMLNTTLPWKTMLGEVVCTGMAAATGRAAGCWIIMGTWAAEGNCGVMAISG